jgi:hypothetical protein
MQGDIHGRGEHYSVMMHGDGGADHIEELILVERKGNWWGGRLRWHVRRRFWIMSSDGLPAGVTSLDVSSY